MFLQRECLVLLAELSLFTAQVLEPKENHSSFAACDSAIVKSAKSSLVNTVCTLFTAFYSWVLGFWEDMKQSMWLWSALVSSFLCCTRRVLAAERSVRHLKTAICTRTVQNLRGLHLARKSGVVWSRATLPI